MDLGRSIGHYRLDRVLGIGSFATVWLAHDEVIDRHVAIKVLADNWSRDLDVRRRFLSEARVLLTADSPRITRAFELGETTDGHPYLVMTWADRGTLAERIASRHKAGEFFTGVEAASIVREVALALADVHALGHLHRDVKPSNVLIRSSSGSEAVAGLAPDEQLMLGDFGLARGLDASAITLVAGSPGYVAPEQARGLEQLDVRADLYSLGRIVLELLIGDPGGHATTMAAAASEHVDVPATLADHSVVAPLGLIALTGELLSFEREHRPADAPEVAERLEPLIEYGESAPLRSVTALGARTKRRAGRRTVVATAVVFVLALVAVLALLLRDRGSPEDAADTTSPAVVSLDLPENAALDEAASDATRTVATMSLTVDEVVAFYSDPPTPWEVVEAPTTSGDTTRMVLAAPTRRATVTVTPAAVTAGPGISRIVIDYE